MRRRNPILILPVLALIAVACGSDDGADETTIATQSASADSAAPPAATTDARLDVTADAPFPTARCEANEAAGTITFLTGFDFAAAASIVDVIAADDAGYYADLCLDVEIRPGFSSANYPLVAEGNAQFASGGSFSEMVNFANANQADFVAVTVEGRTAIDALIVKSGEAAEVADLAGSRIGVKGKLPASIDVMLRQAGLVEGEDFETVGLEGFDPLAHYEIPSIAGFPGWKSNEPGALERADIVDFMLFDPLDSGVPGSFGVIFTSADFIAEHPTAAEDFVRATMHGLATAIADPTTAATTAVDLITENGNPNFLSPDGEIFRWETEAELILLGTPEGVGFGTPDPMALQAELDAYAETGLFGDGEVPDAMSAADPSLTAAVYDADGAVIWPAG
jgi:NitT/TauT family transport system substrate-binding protein